MKKHLPNLLTCANLVCGCMGIDLAYHGHLLVAPFLIIAAAAFDFFDGFAARLLRVSSPIGKELDSLADLVSFGLLPGVILLHLLQQAQQPGQPDWLPQMAWVVPVFSALRLAKFNVDERQSDQFIGVPTPANALLIGSLPLIMGYQPEWGQYLENAWVLLGIGVGMALLLVAELPLFALKFKSFAWAPNRLRYGFLLACVALLALAQFAGLALCIVLYIALSAGMALRRS
jgi:CDP-diacylglycerol--serine O-phosphatidyltransferase